MLPLLLGVFSGWEMISWSVVSVAIACYLMALVFVIYAFTDLDIFFKFPDVC